MTAFSGSFDASQFQPNQGGTGHPVGKYSFTISQTECQQTKDQTGGMFVVTFTSPVGEIKNRYNLWNQNAKAVEIAHGQLSALCHATGIFKLDWSNEGAALRGARGMMEIGYQKGEEPTQEKPAGGYVELKKIYDVNGNEPGKAPASQAIANNPQGLPQTSGLAQPVQQPAQQTWGNQQSPSQAAPPWPGPNPGQTAPAPSQGGWQPGPNVQPNGAAQGNPQAPPGWNAPPAQTNAPPWAKG